MKKRWGFGLVLAAGVVGAMVCRLWQRATAFEESGLLTPGAPATWCLVAVVLAAAVGFYLLGLWAFSGAAPGSYLVAFALPQKGLVVGYGLSAASLIAAGAMELLDYAGGYDAAMGQLFLGLALLLAGAAVVLIAWLNGQRQEGKGRFAWPLLVPGYGGCVWLIVAYQERATEPNIMGYAPYLLGAVCAVVCCYAIAAFSFEKPMARWAVWSGGMALVLLAAGVVDAGQEARWSNVLVQLGYMYYLAAQLACLLSHCDEPAELEMWTPSAPECEEVEIEVTDHE